MRVLDEWVDEPMPLVELSHPHVLRPVGGLRPPGMFRCVDCGRIAVDPELDDALAPSREETK